MIDVENIWSHLQGHFSKETSLKTISTQREFNVVYDRAYDAIKVIPASRKMPRYITKSDFRKVWEKFEVIKEKPYRPGLYQRETRNATYILALIKVLQKIGLKEPSFIIGKEAKKLAKLKNLKGTFANIVRSSWDELEEAGDTFIREELR